MRRSRRALTERGIEVPLIIITGHGDVPMAVQALKGGAADFLQKPFDESVFLTSVDDALSRAGAQTARMRKLPPR